MNLQIFLCALLIYGAAARTCTVRNTIDDAESPPPGSLRFCLERAAESDVDTFLIRFKRSLAGETIFVEPANMPLVEAPGELIVRGLRGNQPTISALEFVDGGSFLPLLFATGPGVDLEISRLTVQGGIECVRQSSFDDEGRGTAPSSLTLTNFHCSDSSGSCVFINGYGAGSYHFRDSSFNNCGFDGITLEPGPAPSGSYEFSLTRVEADGSERTGFYLRGEGPIGFGEVNGCEFSGNGEYGFEAGDNTTLAIPTVRKSAFDNNNEGFEVINGNVDTISFCEFNNNIEYGVGLENARLHLLENSRIVDSGTYGLDLEADASVGEIERTTIKGSGLGVIRCGDNAEMIRSASRSRSDDSARAAANNA